MRVATFFLARHSNRSRSSESGGSDEESWTRPHDLCRATEPMSLYRSRIRSGRSATCLSRSSRRAMRWSCGCDGIDQLGRFLGHAESLDQLRRGYAGTQPVAACTWAGPCWGTAATPPDGLAGSYSARALRWVRRLESCWRIGSVSAAGCGASLRSSRSDAPTGASGRSPGLCLRG